MRQGLEKVLSMSCKSRLHSKERLRHALMAEKEEFNIAPSTSGIILVWGMKVKVLITQSCLTLCNPLDCILQGSSVHGIFQARILEWVAISFSRGSS